MPAREAHQVTPTIEILYFAGCPNVEPACANVRAALARHGRAAEVRMCEIRDEADAIARRFLGSPSVRVDGRDVEPGADARRAYGFMCRTYHTPAGAAGAPGIDAIVAALAGRCGRAGEGSASG